MYAAINSYGIDSPAADANKDTPLFVDQGTVPPGFENLSKPQRTLVDIFYGNRFLGSQLLTYTPTTVQFSDPEAIVRMVGDITILRTLSRSDSSVATESSVGVHDFFVIQG